MNAVFYKELFWELVSLLQQFGSRRVRRQGFSIPYGKTIRNLNLLHKAVGLNGQRMDMVDGKVYTGMSGWLEVFAGYQIFRDEKTGLSETVPIVRRLYVKPHEEFHVRIFA